MIVVSLGGSRIVPKEIDVKMLLDLKELIHKKYRSEKFVFVCGGGYTCRVYQQALRDIKEASNDNLDSLGILATKLNAFLVDHLFSDFDNVTVTGGTVPGHSTDNVAAELAVKHGAKTVVNFSNIKYVYDKDPRVNDDAKPFEKMTFDDYQKQFGSSWSPGMNIPVDFKAIALAKEHDLTISFADSLEGFEAILEGKTCGTVISLSL